MKHSSCALTIPWFMFLLAGSLAERGLAATVGGSGYTETFATQPSVSDWSTYSVPGASADLGTVAAIEGAVQAVAAGAINSPLGADAGNPPAANALAFWSSSGLYVQTRPTGNGATLLMCRLVNGLGTDAIAVTISYDQFQGSGTAEQVPGHRAFYSLTGAAGSWVGIPQFSGATDGRLTTTLNITWPNGSTLYLLWADDNADGGTDLEIRMDNVSVTATPGIQFPVTITQDPQSQTVDELTPVTFTVGVSGYLPPTVQWYTNDVAIAGATSTNYSISEVPLHFDGLQFKVIAQNVASNVTHYATSAVAVLTVRPDLVPPVLLGAASLGLNQIVATFSEPLLATSVGNVANYAVTGPGGSLIISNAVLDASGSNILISVSTMTRDAAYTLTVNGVRDRSAAGNLVAANSQAQFVALSYTPLDIGNPALSGSGSVVGNVFTLTGAGTNIAGNADQFFFYYQSVVGNFDYQVRLDSLTVADAWSQAGLMARESLAANARFAMSVATPSYIGAYFLSRATVGGAAMSAGSAPVNYPHTWLRLVRSNTVFTGYASFDGQTWAQLGTVTLSSPASSFFVGFAVSSTDPTRRVTARFADFGPSPGGPVVPELALPWEPLGPASRNTGLVISEVMYHPKHSNDLEFIEIFNAGLIAENMSGYRISGSVDYTFPQGTILPAGGFLVVARNPALLERAYGITGVLGPWVGAETNGLPDDGGSVRLRHRNMGAVMVEVNYGARSPWPLAADGAGHSLVLARPSYGQDELKAWAASERIGGSPGRAESFTPEPLRNVVVNEFFANSDPPDEDYIELYNYGTTPVNLQGAWLSDDRDTNKFRITNSLVLPPRGFVHFTESQLGFALSSSGERIYLVNSNQTRVIEVVAFEGQAPGVASGRFPDGAPGFHELQTRTPGTTNAPLLIREIVINEIMFHPPSEDDDDQFVELYNRSAQPVDMSNWRFSAGITFNFPSNTLVPPGGYLVVARNKERLFSKYPQLSASNTVGNFTGRLSFGGERLTLQRPEYLRTTNAQGQVSTRINWIPADEVEYVDAGRWARWADGGGSSLELIDPNSDNRLAANWADSDETQKSEWVTISHSGLLDHVYPVDSAGAAMNEVQVMILGAGECLMDDVFVAGTNTTQNLVANPGFDSGLSGWLIQGNHVRSGLEPPGPNNPSQCMRIRATAGGDNGANRVECDLIATLPANSPTVRSTGTISGRFRWLRGFPIVLLRLHGGGLEAVGTLPIPPNLGTPGLPNSRLVGNAGPAIYDVSHSPVLPAANQAVVISARVSDPDGIATVQLQYRLDPSATLTTLTMRDDGTGGDAVAGDGLYSVTLPGQASGTLVAFRITATDTRTPAGSTLFPPDAPTRECLVRFGEPTVSSTLGVYRLWLTSANYNLWANRERLSNEPVDCTFVYNRYRVIYNAGARYRGSPFTRNPANPLAGNANFVWTMPEDDQFLGTDELNIDQLEIVANVRDVTALRELTSFSMAEQLGLPTIYQRYIRTVINGTPTASPVAADVQQPNGEYIAMYFPEGLRGGLYKVDDWFEFDDTPARQGNKSASLDAFYTTNHVGEVFLKKARYRWMWEKKFNQGRLDDDYTDLFAAVNALTVPDVNIYPRQVEAVLQADQWLTALAFRHVVGDWDGYGYNRGKNQFIYRPTGGKWHMLLWDLDFSLGCNGGHGPTQDLFSLAQGGLTASDHMPEVARMYNHPYFRRLYMQALLRCADGPLQDTAYGPILEARYKALLNHGITSVTSPYVGSGAQGISIPAWIQQRRAYIYQQLASSTNVAFAVTSGTSVTSSSNIVTITGNAPLGVYAIRVNGKEYPITWTSVTAWSVRVPISTGTTLLSVQPFDRDGQVWPSSEPVVSATFNGTLDNPTNSIVFSEIMFDPAVPDAEYVELYNRSATTAFDLSGWRINGIDYTFPTGAVFFPRTYLVLAKDAGLCIGTYGTNMPVFGQFGGNLQRGGETLTLIKPGATPDEDVVVNKIRYDGVPPWNTNASGTGSSLQLVDATQDNRRPGNWTSAYVPPRYSEAVYFPGSTNSGWRQVVTNALIGGTPRLLIYLDGPGEVYIDDLSIVAGSEPGVGYNYVRNGDFEMPLIDDPPLTNSFIIPTNYTNTAISTEIKRSGNGSLRIVCSSGGTALNRIIQQNMSPGPTNLFCTLSYWYLVTTNATNLTIRVQNSSLQTTTNVTPIVTPPSYTPPQLVAKATNYISPSAAGPFAASLPPFPPLWLNEVLPLNTSGLTDAAGHRSPWIELYNASAGTVPLEGLYLANNYTNLTQWAFPPGASIGPWEYKVIFADGHEAESTLAELHTSFTLAPGAGGLALSRLHNGQPQVLDYLNYEGLLEDWSFGSLPDGQPFDRRIFVRPTPGTTNTAPPVTVFINEWMASNTNPDGFPDPADGQYDDWFELYNASPEPADISGMYLTDNLANKLQWRIPDGHIIPPFGFKLVWADGQVNQNGTGSHGDLHASFNLRAAGEAIGLYARVGSEIIEIDAVTFGQQFANVSEGRYPDGSQRREFMPRFTPRAPNVSTNTAVNTAPVLAPIAHRTVVLGQSLLLQFSAQDAEAPPQVLTYSLVPPVPEGAFLNSMTGAFQWTPTAQSAPSNYFTVRVTDNGSPPLSDTKSFIVWVVPPPTVLIAPAGADGRLALGFGTAPGHRYRVEYKDDLANGMWTPLPGYEDHLAEDTSLILEIDLADSPQRFYRIVVLD